MNNEIKEILDYYKKDAEKFEYLMKDYTEEQLKTTFSRSYQRYKNHKLLLDYITNLQQENEDNLKCIKNLKEQLESVIKNNQELLEKWHKNNDKIVNLISENERLKENNSDMQEEMARVWEENERLKEENNNKAMNDYAHAIDESWYRELYDDYKSRCEKAIEYNYELQERYCHSAIFDELVASKVYEITEKELNILQNGSDNNEKEQF